MARKHTADVTRSRGTKGQPTTERNFLNCRTVGEVIHFLEERKRESVSGDYRSKISAEFASALDCLIHEFKNKIEAAAREHDHRTFEIGLGSIYKYFLRGPTRDRVDLQRAAIRDWAKKIGLKLPKKTLDSLVLSKQKIKELNGPKEAGLRKAAFCFSAGRGVRALYLRASKMTTGLYFGSAPIEVRPSREHSTDPNTISKNRASESASERKIRLLDELSQDLTWVAESIP